MQQFILFWFWAIWINKATKNHMCIAMKTAIFQLYAQRKKTELACSFASVNCWISCQRVIGKLDFYNLRQHRILQSSAYSYQRSKIFKTISESLWYVGCGIAMFLITFSLLNGKWLLSCKEDSLSEKQWGRSADKSQRRINNQFF